jgi:hypothetical protein
MINRKISGKFVFVGLINSNPSSVIGADIWGDFNDVSF